MRAPRSCYIWQTEQRFSCNQPVEVSVSEPLPPIEFEPLHEETTNPSRDTTDDRDRMWLSRLFLVVALMAALAFIGWSLAFDNDDGPPAGSEIGLVDIDGPNERVGPGYDGIAEILEVIPRPLLAAELFVAGPTGETARDLFEAVGSFDGLSLATAVGAFELVRFDPDNSDRLIASYRLSYGNAENQDINEVWTLTEDGLDQTLWMPNVRHDYAHFNGDGSVTMWVNDGGPGFFSRTAQLMTGDFDATITTAPLYASRFTVDNGVVFALTGNGEYYTNEVGYLELIADDGFERTVLSSASSFEWIDNPGPGLLVAYPRPGTGQTRVWDTSTLEPIDDHPLADRNYQRAAVSGDESTAIGVTLAGEIEVIDLPSGEITQRFGDIDLRGVDQPLTLNEDGTMAITVERSGLVTIWWLVDGASIASIAADSAQPRWLPKEYAAQSTSVVAPDTTRIAIRIGALPEVAVHWSIVDTEIASWVQQACVLADRAMTPTERSALGLDGAERACT
jgi:hypothetical protein